MYDLFSWSPISNARNVVLSQYEMLQPFFFQCLLEEYKPDLFLDIGANIGTYSIFASTIPSIKSIHSFEPNPPVYDELCVNVIANNLSKLIFPHKIAASDCKKSSKMNIVNKFSGANSLIDTIEDAGNCIDVMCARVDSMKPLHNIIDSTIAIKLDVEGHELCALRGLERLLSKNKIILQVESFEQNYAPVSKLLTELGLVYSLSICNDHYWTSSYFTAKPDKITANLLKAISLMTLNSQKDPLGIYEAPKESTLKRIFTRVRRVVRIF